MNRQEAISLIKQIQNVRPSKKYALDIAIHDMEQADKCKWHDLRKNTEDLPKEFEWVTICIRSKYIVRNPIIGYETVRVGSCMYEAYFNSVGLEVIAWKYTEPFESEE